MAKLWRIRVVRPELGFAVFLRRRVKERNSGQSFLEGIPIEGPSGKSPMVVETSSHSGEIRAFYYDLDNALFINRLLSELYGNEGCDIGTSAKTDNSSVVENVHSTNSVTNERRSNCLLDSNREGILPNRRFSMSHIPGGISISAVLTSSTSQTKLISLLAMNKSQMIGEKSEEVPRNSYPSGEQCLAFPDAIRVRRIWTHSRGGAHVWAVGKYWGGSAPIAN